jgi:aryl-phospho-beta-D-glucosidase BglC (GH1 family)
VFKSDLDKVDGLIECLKVKDNQHPILFKKYLSKEICAETLIIINHIQRYFGYWSKNMKNDPIWNEEKNKLLKLTPFLEYNDKYKSMLIEQFRR